jgi:hypothetical protein
MAATIAETKVQAAEVIANGQHFDRNAYIGEWGRRVRNSEVFDGKSFGFFFAKSDAEADDYATRVASRERTPYRVVGVVSGLSVLAWGSELFSVQCVECRKSYDANDPKQGATVDGENLCADCLSVCG